MNVLRALVLALFACLSVPAIANNSSDISEQTNGSVSLFLDELSRGSLEEATLRIAQMPREVQASFLPSRLTSSELVQFLAGCQFDKRRSRGSFLRFDITSWSCTENRSLHVSFRVISDADNPYVIVAALRDSAAEALVESNWAKAPPSPPMPVQLSAEEAATLEREREAIESRQVEKMSDFGMAFVRQDTSLLASLVGDNTWVSLAATDPFYKTRVVALQGEGVETLEDVVRFLDENVGRPLLAACSERIQQFEPGQCVWAIGNTQDSLTASFFFDGEKIQSVEFKYMTGDLLENMRSQAIRLGKING